MDINERIREAVKNYITEQDRSEINAFDEYYSRFGWVKEVTYC